MDKDRIKYLLQQFSTGNLQENERQELLQLVEGDYEKGLNETFVAMLEQQEAEDIDTVYWQAVVDRIIATDKPVIKSFPEKIKALYRWTAAAAIFILISIGVYLFSGDYIIDKEQVEKGQPNLAQDIPPGTNKAILTLGDGKTVILDGAADGLIANEGNTAIVKTNDGQLSYNHSETAEKVDVTYNTVTTPRGGQYSVVLPDGSKVWLNAASSIRFPSAFDADERIVETKGEVYFEINPLYGKRGKIPFIVKSGKQEVYVLGTHFNINAYEDEEVIKTTLLEGAVKISDSRKQQERILKPGQQSVLLLSNYSIMVNSVDVNEAVAWKNNLFQFRDAEIKSVMRQISRWYNVDIDYNEEITEGHLTGYISREVPLSNVLKMLKEISDINFTLQGRKIKVEQTTTNR